jgi:hypothetical protein
MKGRAQMGKEIKKCRYYITCANAPRPKVFCLVLTLKEVFSLIDFLKSRQRKCPTVNRRGLFIFEIFMTL